MRRKTVILAAGIMLIAGAAFYYGGPLRLSDKAAADPKKGDVTYSNKPTSDGVFRDVNLYRLKLGKKVLERHEGLDKLAKDHSEFLRQNRGKFKLSKSGNVSHFGFEGRSAVARSKYGLTSFSENVAAGSRGTSLVNLWANSPAHERSMRASWKYTGVGVVVDSDGMVFATQLFGSPGLPNTTLRQTFGGW